MATSSFACAPPRSITTDVFTVRGMPGIKVPLPVVIGLDMAGEIAEVGPGVPRWTIGDRVLVNPVNKRKGLMGENAGRRHGRVLPGRRRPTRRDAGCRDFRAGRRATGRVWHRASHAGHAPHRCRPASGCWCWAPAGGVGTGCVILAKLLGAEVIGLRIERRKTRSPQGARRRTRGELPRHRLVEMGDRKIRQPQRRSFEGGVDAVINFTGGDTWVPSLRCLKRGGKLLVCGATAGYDPKEDLRYVVELRAENHRLQQFLRRQSCRADGTHRRRQDAAGDRQGIAA